MGVAYQFTCKDVFFCYFIERQPYSEGSLSRAMHGVCHYFTGIFHLLSHSIFLIWPHFYDKSFEKYKSHLIFVAKSSTESSFLQKTHYFLSAQSPLHFPKPLHPVYPQIPYLHHTRRWYDADKTQAAVAANLRFKSCIILFVSMLSSYLIIFQFDFRFVPFWTNLPFSCKEANILETVLFDIPISSA